MEKHGYWGNLIEKLDCSPKSLAKIQKYLLSLEMHLQTHYFHTKQALVVEHPSLCQTLVSRYISKCVSRFVRRCISGLTLVFKLRKFFGDASPKMVNLYITCANPPSSPYSFCEIFFFPYWNSWPTLFQYIFQATKEHLLQSYKSNSLHIL